MPIRYLEDVSIADVAFEATETTREGIFVEAGKATAGAMVENLNEVRPRVEKAIQVRHRDLDLLLFDFLQELIFYKDAEELILIVDQVAIEERDGEFQLSATARGEKIDPARHQMGIDVKAVTLHRFELEETDKGWRATVILDV